MSKNCCIMKAVKKFKIVAIVCAVILAAGILVGAIFGVNQKASMGSYATLTVQVSGVSFEAQGEEVESAIEEKLAGLNVLFSSKANVSTAEKEYVYYFAKGTDLTEVKASVQGVVDAAAAKAENAISGGQVMVTEETAVKNTPAFYTLRTVIAIAVFAVVAFAYAFLRYRLAGGIVATVSVALSAALSFAVTALTRIPADGYIVATYAFAALTAAVMTLFTLSKVRALEGEEKAKEMSEEEKVVSSLSVKSVLALAVALVGGLALIVAFGPSRLFAVHAILAVVVATFVALIAAPSLYIPLREKLGAKTVKFSYKKAEKPVEEKEETVTTETNE